MGIYSGECTVSQLAHEKGDNTSSVWIIQRAQWRWLHIFIALYNGNIVLSMFVQIVLVHVWRRTPTCQPTCSLMRKKRKLEYSFCLHSIFDQWSHAFVDICCITLWIKMPKKKEKKEINILSFAGLTSKIFLVYWKFVTYDANLKW